jgi:signal transduction histidine kinase
LARQFVLAGGAVTLVAMLLIGAVVTYLIEAAVTRNSAATTALYVDSVIAPLLPDMQRTEFLDESVAHALDETLAQGALADRLMSFRLWRQDGTILYADDKSLVGKRFALSDDLRAAFAGRMAAEFDQIEDPESAPKRASGVPLLEIYNPVLQPWSGKVVAVSEFYEMADGFQHDLRHARLMSWAAVAGATTAFFVLLSTIVLRGSRTIDRQSQALTERVAELSALLEQNRALHARVQGASRRAAALNENFLRRIGADLHDGPAQLIALALLRLDSPAFGMSALPEHGGDDEIASLRSTLEDALDDIRSICSGLVLPHIEEATLPQIVELAAAKHEARTGTTVRRALGPETVPLSAWEKICVYRFVQEGLGNAFRHAGGRGQSVAYRLEPDRLTVEVADEGDGFDPTRVRPGALGLAGLRQRVESVGARFSVETSAAGTRLSMTLAREEDQAA